ncbi:MAG: hypothetical protein CW338_08785 [Clostridiales bacterium]|nr:hypothetical protein [Clostridiales bacterium]
MRKKKSKATVAGIVSFGVVMLVVLAILGFNFTKLVGLIIGGVVALGAGFVVYNMAKGVDTSKPAPAQRKWEPTGNSVVDDLVRDGQEMLAKIRHENELISDEQVSLRIDAIEDTTAKIFDTVAQEQDKAPQIRRFMKYYLPTTLKMLTAYRTIDERGLTGSNAEETRSQIENALDVAKDAFNKQLESMHETNFFDLSTDIEVMEMMLKQDGLTDSGLHEDIKEEVLS